MDPVAEQSAFAEKLASVKIERQKLMFSCHASDALFASLQHRAFRGEL